MAHCAITLEMLIEEQQGRADADTQARIRAHDAASCPQCQRHTLWIGRFVDAIGEIGRLTIPEDATERATALFREKFVESRRPSLLARLIFDSRTQMRPAFARGGRPAAWQRMYGTEDYHVELWQEGDAREGWYLIGQILPTHDGAAIPASSALLIGADGTTHNAFMNDSEFHIVSLPAGTYQIHLQMPEGSILLPDVAVGA